MNNTATIKETSFIQAFLTLSQRWLWRLRREPSALVASVVQPVIWLVLFGNLFSSGLEGLGESYIAFMTAGVIVMTVFNGAMAGGVEILFDRESKLFERLVAAPIPPVAVMTSRFGFVVALTTLQSAIIIPVAWILGVQIGSGLAGLLLILLTGMILGVGMLAVSTALAFGLRSHAPFFSISGFITLPLIFASNALAPIESMPGWLQVIARVNPMTYTITSVRTLMLDGIYWTEVLSTLAVLVLFAGLMLIVCFWFMQRALR